MCWRLAWCVGVHILRRPVWVLDLSIFLAWISIALFCALYEKPSEWRGERNCYEITIEKSGCCEVELENLSPKLCVRITLFLYLYIYLPLFALIEMTSI